MKRYAAIIFDWDGTVMDSTYSIAHAIQLAAADVGLPVPSLEQASWVIGLSLESALYRAVPDLDEQRLPLFLQRYRFHYFQRDPHLVVFDGMLPLLAELRRRNTLLAVATGKSREGLNRVLQRTELSSWFDSTRCADETRGKPDPEMLNQILFELALEPEQVLMVGDTSHDINMAQRAKMDSMAVTYGAHDKESLIQSGPTVLVSSVSEMRSWILGRVR